METEILQQKEIKRIPKLRFGEFENAWKEVRLGKICSTFKSGFNITSKDIQEKGDYPVYGGNGQRGFATSYTHNGFYVLIGRQGALCGNINRINGKAFISEHAIVVEADSSSDTEWLAQKLDLLKLNRLSESSAQPGLAVGKLVRLKINIPSLPEQQKIASFLSAVDKKTQQLTRKEELLEIYKKGVMRQLFSQEIRFKTGNGKDFPKWEEKKLMEVGKIITGSTPPTADASYYAGKRLFVSPADINSSRFINDTKTKITDKGIKKGRLIKKGGVLFVCIGSTIGKVAQAGDECITNQQINSIESNQNHSNDFIYALLTFYGQKIKLLAGVQAVPQINKTDFSNLKYEFPSLVEQQKIADFLAAIDRKIEAVQKQITKTQSFKKGLLQQMFV